MTPSVHRLGVLGGAFDPPHNAHVALAQAAVQQLQLDRLLVFPTGVAWHKDQTLTEAVHRVAMAQLAFGGLDRVVVDDRETRRPGPTYTIDTLRDLAGQYQGSTLFLLLGADQARALPQWHQGDLISQFAIICVADRGEVQAPLDARFTPVRMAPTSVSSSRIRELLAAGQDADALVPQSIARYIAQHHLYQNPR